MSDFKKIKDFQKSSSRGKYTQYQDPTYLSFLLLFDFSDSANSPFLAKPAEDFLAKLAEDDEYYKEKLEALKNFKKALKIINNEMPWYWQSLSGLEKIQQYDPLNGYRGGEDSKLIITTLESINLTVSGLMHLYRKAVFDENRWSYVLPANLRKFRMYTYVTEVRSIKNMTSPKIGGLDLKGFPSNFKPSIGIENSNSGISGTEGRPYFMFALKFCEFDLDSGTTIFADLQKSPTDPAAGEISISYEGLHDIEARVLNGIITSEYNENDLAPAPDLENKKTDGIGDWLKDKAVEKGAAFADRAITDLKNTALNKVNELKQKAKDATVGRVNAVVNNLYEDFVKGIDSVANPAANASNIQTAITDNIHGLTGNSTTISGALNSAASNSLGNIHN